MRRHALASLTALSLAGWWPQATPPPERVNFPSSNPTRDIADALSHARRDHKYVLLDFGADWCMDCRVLEQAFRDPAITPFLKLHFHVVRIDVGEFFKGGDAFKHRDVAARYGVTDPNLTGVPVLVTLDGDGQVVYGTSRVHWGAARQFNLADVLLYLRKTLPPAEVSRLEAFTERGVRVEITFDHDIFGLNWLSARFTPTTAGFQLGRTGFELTTPGSVRARGQTFQSADATLEHGEILKQPAPMYPAGPVVLRIPIARQEKSATPTEVSITYMACGPTGCLPAVEDKRIRFTVRLASEVHELGLFTTGEMLDAFWQAGLDVDHDPKGLSDRGLFVARAALEHVR